MEIDKRGQLYIGRESEGGDPVLLKASALTTHGVIFGMTGSGKTGLGVNMLEEALLGGTPTLILDPKGDMGNILLNFPESSPEDLEPWMDAGKAKRKGVSVADLAAKESAERQADLAGDGITPERIARLRDNTDFKIYTPGSSIGVPINVLGSLKAPDLDWEDSAEIIRDEIEGLVSSILLFADVDSDPASGPEHILIATIIETWWKQGKDLDLATLVGQIPKPPFRKLGVFDLEMFFPEKQRMKLALQLNGLLASPSMASWLQGEPLDIEKLLGANGKTPCAIIYMAHLNEKERQFVVTLLLSKVVTWMRSKPGTSELSALIYMDEAFGYAPPSAEPPSKKPILTILKQARAFGVGLVLVTQNPVDLDYKAMSNAGTWIVGRLQTDNDKRRILDGISNGMPDLDARISNLEKRQFILHLAKKNKQTVLHRRHSMCFRFGPFTRAQVTELMEAHKTEVPDEAEAPAPAAAVTVQLLYDETRADVAHNENYEAVIFPLDGIIDVEDVLSVDHDDRDFNSDAPDGTGYELGNTKLQNKTFWTGLRSDVKNHLVRNRSIEIWKCPGLKLYSRVGESEEDFRRRCDEAADDAADIKIAKLKDRFEARIKRLQDQISTADARVAELEVDVSSRRQTELMSGVGDLLGGLLKGRLSSRSMRGAASRRAASKKASVRLTTAKQKADAKRKDLVELENDLRDELLSIQQEHDALANAVETMEIGLEKTDIQVAEAKLVWVPVS